MNIILIDFEPNSKWNFDKMLAENTHQEWKVFKKISNTNQGNKMQLFIRYFKYFVFPISFVLNSKNYGNIIAWQQFYGIVYAFYYRLFRVKSNTKLFIMTFIYKEKKGKIGKFYYKFINYALGSRCIEKIFVFSQSEQKYYSEKLNININKFASIDLGVEDVSAIKNTDQESSSKEKFYLSVGRSNRDYGYLIKNWDYSLGKLKIITDIEVKNNYDSNFIEIIKGCYENDYYKILSECYAVIVILEDENISSGELVAIQAGMFSKPIIATENYALKDYIANGYNGFICSKDKFKSYVKKLDDENYYKLMCSNAREKYENCYSLENMAKSIAEYIK